MRMTKAINKNNHVVNTEDSKNYSKEIQCTNSNNTNNTNNTHQTKDIYFWSIIDDCTKEYCPARDVCVYDKYGKCQTMRKYFKSFQDIIIKNFKHKDESILYRVGMHLAPIYRQLCKLKIYEISIINPVCSNAQGNLLIHPVYKEMREVIKTLELLWKSMGLDTSVNTNTPMPDLDFGTNGMKRHKSDDTNKPLVFKKKLKERIQSAKDLNI